jgi:hypothetical protein
MADAHVGYKLGVREELEDVDKEVFRKDFSAMINSISASSLSTLQLKAELEEFVTDWMDMYDNDVYAFRHYFMDLAFHLAESNTEHQLNPYHYFEFEFYDGSKQNVRLAACTEARIISKKYKDAVIVKFHDSSAPNMRAFDTEHSIGDWVKPLHYNITHGFDPEHPLVLPHGFIGLISEFKKFTCSTKAMIEHRLKHDPHILHGLPKNWFDKMGMTKDSPAVLTELVSPDIKWEPLQWRWADDKIPSSVKEMLTIINKPITICTVQFNHDLKIGFYSHELVKVDGPAKPTTRRRFVE